MSSLKFKENVSLASMNNLHLEARARFFCEPQSDDEIDAAIEFAGNQHLPIFKAR